MTFNISKTINYWIESAEYDFETGKTLLESKKFPYALFFAHLAEVYQWLKKKLSE